MGTTPLVFLLRLPTPILHVHSPTLPFVANVQTSSLDVPPPPILCIGTLRWFGRRLRRCGSEERWVVSVGGEGFVKDGVSVDRVGGWGEPMIGDGRLWCVCVMRFRGTCGCGVGSCLGSVWGPLGTRGGWFRPAAV